MCCLEILGPPYLPLRSCLLWGKGIKQEMKSSITGRQHTSRIIRWDVLHSRAACQKIVPASRDASGHGAAKAHYKSQPSSVLSHPLLWPSSCWEPGECEAPSCPPHSPTGGLSSLDLSAALSCVPCQILGLLVVGESRGRRFVMEEDWAFGVMAPVLEPRVYPGCGGSFWALSGCSQECLAHPCTASSSQYCLCLGSVRVW